MYIKKFLYLLKYCTFVASIFLKNGILTGVDFFNKTINNVKPTRGRSCLNFKDNNYSN